MDSNYQKPLRIYLVSSPDSPEFSHLSRALTRSNLIAFDAEWKPIRSHQPNFPIVSLLQLACQFDRRLCSDSDELNESAVYLLDLSSIPLSSIWKLLKEVFVSPDVLKLGFKFKQDLIYLSSTFCLQGCEPGFDRVEPYLDIASIYNYLQHKQHGRKLPKETKSLATICKEVLGISLSKKSRKLMLLQMLTACLKYLIASRIKFLRKVEGLAKHLRCVGIDAAIPNSKKPESRELIDQAYKEKRVLLTRDAKLLKHQYLIKNQIYRVKSLLKNEQLLEVIETFQLKISEDQLMSRCTKCNGRFIQKPLSMEEAVEAAKGFQRIPDCLFDKNLEFWQCIDCHQLYWEGTQYHNAVQKFINVCKLSE